MYITVRYRAADCDEDTRIVAKFQFRTKEDGTAEGKWSFEPAISDKTKDPTGLLQGLLDLVENLAAHKTGESDDRKD